MSARAQRRTTARTLAAATAGLLALGIASCVSERTTAVARTDGNCVAPASTAGAAIVFIKQFAYLPAEVHVRAGQSVAWVNCEPDDTPHTATADDASWNSGLLSVPDAYIRAFPDAGTVPYHCDLHPFMKATVVVD